MPPEARTAESFVRLLCQFQLSKPVSEPSDLADGNALYDVLAVVDSGYFQKPSALSTSAAEEWVDRLNALKKLHRLLMQYFTDVLRQPTANLDVPDLTAIAKESSTADLLSLCKLVLAAAVQSEKKKDIIDRIQLLSDEDQHHLMRAIEQVMGRLKSQERETNRTGSTTDDDRVFRLQTELSEIIQEKEGVEKTYQELLREHQSLQGNLEDITVEKDELNAQLRIAKRDAADRHQDRADAYMRSEIDRLRADLQKAEDGLNVAESELERQTTANASLTRQMDELQSKADEATRLKDQVDELRHAAERLHKTENVMEKYKKKLEESADLRRRIKSLEDQNASLVDKNASLEEEHRKVAGYKPLIDSYKSQVSELETKLSSRTKEMDALNFELDQTKVRLKVVSEEREKDGETLELYQERVRELEFSAPKAPSKHPPRSPVAGNMSEMTMEELMADEENIGGELEDALTGTTTTDLKLQIRRLQRELDAVKSDKADSSRLLVLENLLEDANRMKSRYESEYLSEHREKLLLQSHLEEIRSGKAFGDGAEASMALRLRLNETVDALDSLRKEHNSLGVQFSKQSEELTVAKSDLTLVNKDQLDILTTLRESVNADKASLETDVERLKKNIKELQDKNRMQLEQINTLLIEKVNLQSESIGQRERALDRERDFSDLRASISGKDLPEDVKSRLLSLHEDNVLLKEQVKATNDKLVKAKAFIKNQDQLFKAEAATRAMVSPPAASTDKQLVEENQRLKHRMEALTKIYEREQRTMMGMVHQAGQKTIRNHFMEHGQAKAVSWLGQRRQALEQTIRRR